MSRVITFGQMISISEVKKDNRSRTYLLIKCSICGVEREAYINSLNNGKGLKHGQACSAALNDGTETFRLFNLIYKGINRRVNNKNFKYYHYYGGRGIKNEFENFPHFYKLFYKSYIDAINRFGKVDLDRINNDGNYSPENCRWVTHLINSQNRGRTKKQRDFIAVSPNGLKFQDYNITAFAAKNGLSYKVIWKCLSGRLKKYKGWEFKYK